MKGLFDRLSREPVLGFAAVGLAITAWLPQWVDNDAKKLAMAGIIAWLQRTFSKSKKTAEEDEEAAKYVGAVEHQAVVSAGTIIARTKPAAPKPPITAA